MPIVVLAVAVAVLLVLMTRFKLNGFVALILVAVLVGLLQGMDLPTIYESVVEGVGGQLDELVLILGFGAMLGKILADSGAAQRVATRMVQIFGISRVQLAMVLTAFAIGITMFYEVGFVLLIPIVFTIVRENKLPLLWVGLPMSIALSTMHSFLPPHPGPAAVADAFDASMGLTLFYGLFIAMPAAAIIAFTWPRLPFNKRMTPSIPTGLITERQFREEQMPSFGTCLFVILTPVVLMGASAVATIAMSDDNAVLPYITFFGESPVALLIALLIGIQLLGPNVAALSRAEATSAPVASAVGGGGASATGAAEPGATGAGGDAPYGSADNNAAIAVQSGGDRYAAVMHSASESVKPMAMIILVIGAGGAFKQVLVDSGMADYVTELTNGWNVSPLILAWGIAALLRVALGSATVAVVTAAGVVLPLVESSGTSPELMVLAVSCGSIFASHVNDPGFWLFKEYFGLSVVEALKTRTSYTTCLSILGIIGLLIENTIVG